MIDSVGGACSVLPDCEVTRSRGHEQLLRKRGLTDVSYCSDSPINTRPNELWQQLMDGQVSLFYMAYCSDDRATPTQSYRTIVGFIISTYCIFQ